WDGPAGEDREAAAAAAAAGALRFGPALRPRSAATAEPEGRRTGQPSPRAPRSCPDLPPPCTSRFHRSPPPWPLRPSPAPRNHRSSLDSSPEASSRDMSSAPTTPPSVDKVDGFSRKSVRKARQKRSQSSSQFRSQGKPIELTPLPLLKGKAYDQVILFQ
uniref:Protein phosphatase 2 regulatory subunit B'epsilon n=1 Tax=Urocitellus parryii TaxID=9999 RepID=A0A8D2HF75_UROPR